MLSLVGILFITCSRAIKFKDALCNLAYVETNYTCFPSYLEWRRREMICELLSSFSKMKNLISRSSYPTSDLYFMQVWKIESWLRFHKNIDDLIISEIVESMMMKFDKYWEEYSDILTVVFDSRLKFTFLEYCFSILYILHIK